MHQHNQNIFLARSLFILLTIACAPRALADVWTVDDNGPADFSTIQAAVDAAQDGDQISVAAGTYTGSGANVIDFLGKDLELIGAGFVTKIDGQTSRRGALVDSAPGASPRLQGLCFVNCVTSGDGGGARVTSDEVSVTDCTFLDCYASGLGGGLFVDGCSDARIDYVDFEDCKSLMKRNCLYVSNSTVLSLNEAKVDSDPLFGHGFYFMNSVITDTPPNAGSINLCSIRRVQPGLVLDGSTLESATEFSFTDIADGPALILQNGSNAKFNTSTWLNLDEGIQAEGTAFSLDLESCQLNDVIFGVRIEGNSQSPNHMKTVRIANCKLVNCWMRTVSAEHAKLTIEDSLIKGCGCAFDSEVGGSGSSSLMAAVTAWEGCELYITRTKFSKNLGGYFGAGVRTWRSQTVIDECTFYRNRAGYGTKDDPGTGAGLHCLGGELTVKNSTFEKNTATDGGAICVEGWATDPALVVIEDCRFERNKGDSADEGTMGGAICILNGLACPAVTVRRCTFYKNIALSGGAIATQGANSLILEDSHLSWNEATGPAVESETAGAVAVIGASSYATLENNFFLCNTPKHISTNCVLLPGNTFFDMCGHWKIWVDGPNDWWRTIDWKSGRVYEVLEQPLQISDQAERALGSDGLLYAAEFDAMRVSRWDPSSGEYMGDLVNPDMGLAPVAVGFSGEQAVVLDGGGALFLMDPESGEVQSVLEGGSPFAANLGMGPDGLAYVLTQGWNTGSIVEVWDLEAQAIVKTLAADSFWLEVPGDVSVLPDGRVLVSDEAAGVIHQFDGASSAYMGLFMDSGQNADLGLGWLRDLAVAPDGSLYMATESGIHLFDAEGNYRKPLLVNGAPALANKLVFLPPKTAPTPPSMK